jgi:hypothetical protein
MHLSRNLKAGVLGAACLGAAVPATAAAQRHPHAQAAAHTVKYSGKTRHGDPISFTLTGSRIAKVKAYAPTLCLPTHGLTLTGTDAFDPPGSFVLGRTGKATAKRHNSMWDTSDVTKNFTLATKRTGKGRISGSVHADFSFLMLVWTYPMSARPYVCTGDTTFTVKPQR